MGTLLSVASITSLLQQNSDWESTWAGQIFDVITKYDNQISEAERQKEVAKAHKAQKARVKRALDEIQSSTLQNDHPMCLQNAPAWQMKNIDTEATYLQEPDEVLGDQLNRVKQQRKK